MGSLFCVVRWLGGGSRKGCGMEGWEGEWRGGCRKYLWDFMPKRAIQGCWLRVLEVNVSEGRLAGTRT